MPSQLPRRKATPEPRLRETLKGLSDAALRDAHSSYLSPRGALSAVFQAGYCALLSSYTTSEIQALEHPALAVVPEGVAARFVVHQYDSDGEALPTFKDLLAWAMEQRAKAGFESQ